MENNMEPNTSTKAFVPASQGEVSPSLTTQDKNGTTSPLCKVGEETTPCATGGINNNSTPELENNLQEDRNEGTVADTKKDPEGSEVAGNEVSSTVQEFSTINWNYLNAVHVRH